MTTQPAVSSAAAQIRQCRQRALTSIVREDMVHLMASAQLKAGESINESQQRCGLHGDCC